MNPLKIVFAGTPAFTIPSLEAVHASKHQLLCAYTQPDRPAGRGQKLQTSAVKDWAIAHGVALRQPVNFKDPKEVEQLAELAPDLLLVIAYGLILPAKVLALPRLGCVNVHASLLPRWRGASPIQHAILQGDTETGVTIMQMDAGMDTGAMLMKASCPIHATDTAATLHDRLAQLAVEPLLQSLDKLANSALSPTAQNHEQATYAGKIQKDDAKIDWSKTAFEIDCQIRAFNPWPIAFTRFQDLLIRIHQATLMEETVEKPAGSIVAIHKQGIQVATAHGCILIQQLQFPGGKKISVSDYLNSNKNLLQVNMVLQ